MLSNKPVHESLETPDIPEREVKKPDISTDPITVEVVGQAIKKIKTGKTSGEDEICAQKC